MKTFQQKLGKLPVRWRWTMHNLIGHPVSELSYQLGFVEFSDWIHDATIPNLIGEDLARGNEQHDD